MKHKLLTLSIVAALTACGGSDDETAAPVEPTAPKFSVQVKADPTCEPEEIPATEEGAEPQFTECELVWTELADEDVFASVATKLVNPSGQYKIADANPGESLYYPLDAVGTYGEFTFSANGEWSYTLWRGKADSDTPEHLDVKNLVSSQLPDLTDIFTVTTADGTEKQFIVTIEGIDEPATFGGRTTQLVQRDTGKGSASGETTVADANPAEAIFKPALEQPGAMDVDGAAIITTTYGEVTVEVTEPGKAKWTYDLDEMNEDVIALDSSEKSMEDTFTLLSDDGTEQVITITIKGSDQVPATFVGDAATLTTNEDGTFSAMVSVNDGSFASSIAVTDPNFEEEFFVAETKDVTYGSVSIDAAGAFSYTIDYSKEAVKVLLLDAAADPLPTEDETLTFTTVDGTEAKVTLSLEAALLVPAVIDGLPVIEGGVSKSAVNVDLLTTSGLLSVTDTNSWQAVFVPQTDMATTYGLFTIDAAGAWSYTLDPASIAGLTLPFTEDITVSAVDGTEETLKVSITAPVALNYGAQLGSDNDADAKWVMDMPAAAGEVGKATFTLRVPEKASGDAKDIKVQIHGASRDTGVNNQLFSMVLQDRTDTIFIYDGTGTSTSTNAFAHGETFQQGQLLKFEFTWDASAATLAANGDKPLLSMKINGKPLTGHASIVDGVFPSFSTADVSYLDKGPKLFEVQTKGVDKLDIDDFKVYSDLAGTTEIFSESFDADGIAEGAEISLSYLNGATTANAIAVGVEFPPADKFLRLSNDDSNYGGTTLQFPKQEKGSVTFDVRMSTSAHSGYATLLGGGELGQAKGLVDFDMKKEKTFKVRGSTGNIPVIRYPMGEWFPIELSWDATGDGTPTVIMKLNGTLVTDIPGLTLAADGSFESTGSPVSEFADGVDKISFKCGYNVNTSDPSVCEFDNLVVKAADGSEVASENFDTLETGEDALTANEVLQSGMTTLGTVRNADIIEK